MQLNKAQKRAVEYLDGPLLVLAGPGTGKTQLLSQKVAYVLKNTDTNPENILCMTFTDSGAGNMRERLKSIIGQDAARVNIGTYHAFGADILAQYK
ncbi:UvrD-helicase domain-containing protein, partial [Candidatus Saccharibacteria bacterium]|nr:UvrD-helicase domain-containing protein [Candidatus Saccharibacteria bacterium]